MCNTARTLNREQYPAWPAKEPLQFNDPLSIFTTCIPSNFWRALHCLAETPDKDSSKIQLLQQLHDVRNLLLQQFNSLDSPPSGIHPANYQLETWEGFGEGFREVVNAVTEGRTPNSEYFRQMPSQQQIWFRLIYGMFELELARNSVAATFAEVTRQENAKNYFIKKYADKLLQIQNPENSITVQSLIPGVFRFFVSEGIFEALGLGQAQAFAQKASNDQDVAFTAYRATRAEDKNYLDENIPHETLHTLLTQTFHGSKVFPCAEPDPIVQASYNSYREEAICQRVGGSHGAYSMINIPPRLEKIEELTATIFESACDFLPDALPDLLSRCKLRSTVLLPCFIFSRSYEELLENLTLVRNSLLEIAPPPTGRAGTFEDV